MNQLEVLRESLGQCDEIILDALLMRNRIVEDIMAYKEANDIPILQPEQEAKQKEWLERRMADRRHKAEVEDVFGSITQNSKRIQARKLFNYNIVLIGFMGAGKSTISEFLKTAFAMDVIEMDQIIAEREGMTISDIFEVYGEQYEEIAEDDLMQAFSSAIDEMEKSGAIRISQEQESIIKNMIKEELPSLTQDLNSLAMQYDVSGGELTNDATSTDDMVKTVLSRGMQMIMLLISVALCAALIALFWKNKSGFIWCAVVTGVVTACYVLLTVLGASGTLLAGGSPGDAFVLTLLSHGFKVAAIIGGVVTCIFVAAYIVWRARDRRKEEYEENIETAKRFA